MELPSEFPLNIYDKYRDISISIELSKYQQSKYTKHII